MEQEIKGFTKVEFLVIIISITYGFCIVEILTSWTRLMRKGVKIYTETLAWSAVLFIGISILWYNSWDNIHLVERSSGNFIGTLIPPIGLFIMVSALFPDQDDKWDLEKVFKQNRKIFFSMYALVNASVLVLSNLISRPTAILNYSRFIWLVACILMFFVDSKALRYAMVGGLIAWYGYMILISDI